ncbi:MAG: urease accessory protein UreD, partial [Deltaproteobacteria bacterium]|nr:urease accessory protein UreD [Deltaproteobacteria bacterium]
LRFEGPLKVQRLFYPEKKLPGRVDPCHLYLLHPPGGLVSGDRLGHDISLADGAHALITTPAATKIYGARSGQAPQTVSGHIQAGDQSLLEWLPQGTIVFSGARANLASTFDLHPGARALGCDFVALGRPASNEPFAAGTFRQLTQIRRHGRLLFHELLNLSGGQPLLASPFGLMGRPVLALFWALGRQNDSTDAAALSAASRLLALREAFGGPPGQRPAATGSPSAGLSAPGPICSVTLKGELLLARALANSLEEAEAFRLQVWSAVRPALLGRETLSPHIWSH